MSDKKELATGDVIQTITYKGKRIEIRETVQGKFFSTIHNEFISDAWKYKGDALKEATIHVDNEQKKMDTGDKLSSEVEKRMTRMSGNELTVNDPKKGWAHAIDVPVNDIEDALKKVQQYKAKNPKYQFAARIDGKTYWYKGGAFVR